MTSMPDDILISLGFVKKPCRFSGKEEWTHLRGLVFYYHMLTPDQVMIALIEIGHQEFRRRAEAELASIDMDE